MKIKNAYYARDYKILYPTSRLSRLSRPPLLLVRISLDQIESELKRRSLEANRAQALEDPSYNQAVFVIESGKWDSLYEAQALVVRRYLQREIGLFLSRALDRSIDRVLSVAKTRTSEGELLDLYMESRNIFPPGVLQSYILNDETVTSEWMEIHPQKGRSAEYDLSSFRDKYHEAYQKARIAKNVYKANRNSTKWENHIRTEVPDMPADLIRRVSGNPRDLTEVDKKKLGVKGGTASTSDIAYEWAARLCGVPAYRYALKTLKAELTEQNKQRKNLLPRKSKARKS
jgi:hypothetical protein